jgi:hypothetical protein
MDTLTLMKQTFLENYSKRIDSLYNMNEPYISFYKAWYSDGSMHREPWACISVTKFDTEECNGELRTLDHDEIMFNARKWARKHLGAKFPGDENADGTYVSSFTTTNTSANCEVLIDALPFFHVTKR